MEGHRNQNEPPKADNVFRRLLSEMAGLAEAADEIKRKSERLRGEVLEMKPTREEKPQGQPRDVKTLPFEKGFTVFLNVICESLSIADSNISDLL